MSIEDVRQLGTEELCQWLKTQLDDDEWNDAELIIRQQKIKGKNFLRYTYEQWKAEGLLGGQAMSLVQIAQEVSMAGAAVAPGCERSGPVAFSNVPDIIDMGSVHVILLEQ